MQSRTPRRPQRANSQARFDQFLLRADAGPLRSHDRGRARPDRLPARRQRQRQVDDHEVHPRAAAAALGRGDARRHRDHRPADAADHPARDRLGAGGAAPVRRHDGARERADGCLHAQRRARGRGGLRAHAAAVSAAGRAPGPARRHALGRRAADGGDGARADGPAAADVHGRADHGPVAALCRSRAGR